MTNIKDYLVGQIPLIRPISVLRNTTEVTELCHQGMRPLFLTKNGYGDMVIMSMDTYEMLIENVSCEDEPRGMEKDQSRQKDNSEEKL